MPACPTRRRFLHRAGRTGLLALPLLWLSPPGWTATNAALRAQFKYQDSPVDGKSCTSCLEFVAGATAEARGRCKLMPGDDEIAPNGYCSQWNSM